MYITRIRSREKYFISVRGECFASFYDEQNVSNHVQNIPDNPSIHEQVLSKQVTPAVAKAMAGKRDERRRKNYDLRFVRPSSRYIKSIAAIIFLAQAYNVCAAHVVSSSVIADSKYAYDKWFYIESI